MSKDHYERACFVIMPFGRKPVDGIEVDFDMIYHEIFKPAIERAELPEGGTLEPRRTDQEMFSSSINQDMFDYLTYSRLALTDISGGNANAMYELGIRHAVQEAGTVILRQEGQAIPYDIRTIKAFEYKTEAELIAEQVDLISTIMTETLKHNRLDSPVRQALGYRWDQREAAAGGGAVAGAEAEAPTAPRATGAPLHLDVLLQEAQDAVRQRETAIARTIYEIILRIDPQHMEARMRLGLLLKDSAAYVEAHEEFATLVRLYPTYGEAWREKAVTESFLMRRFPEGGDRDATAGLSLRSFRKALSLIPDDPDAMSAWGGVLRRTGDESGALDQYQKAAKVSDGDPYALLNAMKLEAKQSGTFAPDPELLRKARDRRMADTRQDPPKDMPWSCFDLTEIMLYEGDVPGAMETLETGLAAANPDQAQSFYDTMKGTLVAAGITVPGLDRVLRRLEGVKGLTIAK